MTRKPQLRRRHPMAGAAANARNSWEADWKREEVSTGLSSIKSQAVMPAVVIMFSPTRRM